MEDCQASALRTLNSRLHEVDLGFVKDYRIIGLQLKPDFVFSKSTASPALQPQLRSVTRSVDKWQLVLDGPNGDSAIVLLNDHCEVVSVSIIPRGQAR